MILHDTVCYTTRAMWGSMMHSHLTPILHLQCFLTSHCLTCSLCTLAGDHLGVMPDNFCQVSEEKVAEFAAHLGVENLDHAFDLEAEVDDVEAGAKEPAKPFPLPQTYRNIFSGQPAHPCISLSLSGCVRKPNTTSVWMCVHTQCEICQVVCACPYSVWYYVQHAIEG